MTCYKPITAWHSKVENESGKRSLVFNQKAALQPDAPIEIACGQCLGCRIDKSRQWAVRCMHEASLYENNCFLTLTFSPESLSKRKYSYSLDVTEFQKFMKRLRKKYGGGIRFFHCGEYGDKYGRPHYHALLFNHDFEDKELFAVRDGYRLYSSESLSRLWPYGFATIGDVTFESAAYVARYVMKKITGEDAEEHYRIVDPETGEIYQRKPEYITMSRRPGIGKEWFDKFQSDVYPHDYVIVDGRKVKTPRYYDKLYEEKCGIDIDMVKHERNIKAAKRSDDNTRQRLDEREKVHALKMKQLHRGLEDAE
jgi:hypothetical protein